MGDTETAPAPQNSRRTVTEELTEHTSSDRLAGCLENEVEDNKKLLVIVEHDGKKVAIKISELLNQQQVVIKNLEQNYQAIKNFSGATILGDGTVSLILDIAAIVEHNS